MNKVVLGIAAIAALIGTHAFAADMPVPEPPLVAAAWTGCYVGGNAGGVLGWDQYSLAMGGQFLNPSNIFSSPTNNALLAHSYNSTADGVAGGGQIGCNWQTSSSIVLGVEADLNSATKLTDNHSFGAVGPFVPVPGNNPGARLAASHTESVTKDLNWFSTFRGRVGFLSTPTVLLYGTGGLAVAQINSGTNVTFGADQFYLNSFVFQGSNTVTRVGWTVGAGAEWMFAPNWSLKAEYLFLDFGSFAYNSPCIAPSVAGSCVPGTNFLWTTNVRAMEQIARVGVNYHFNWIFPTVARY